MVEGPAQWPPGTTFVPTEEGWLVHGPDEDFMVLDVPAENRRAVADLIAGRLDAATAAKSIPGAADLLAELTPPPPRGARTEVLLVGEGFLADELTAELTARPDGFSLRRLPDDHAVRQALPGPAARHPLDGFAVRHAADDLALRQPLDDHAARQLAGGVMGPDAGAAVLVACAERLPDARWRELDALCRDAGIPWHRGHSEGRRWYVGPFTPAHGGAGYEDVRLRRLAACPWPEELAAYWAFLDGGGLPAAPADPRGAVVAAALIAADLRAWRAGLEPPGAGVQVGIDLHSGRLRRHPVLPVPHGLMRETPA
ncbi:hypothetical protein C1I98_20850 [Spongiactinospora gelatinilytica]|uniref:Uncharacterized protein n=1 Tax=Spongiactinospora gelatinilytica TaxID=2666298 RepID=A0A2W2HSQ6_9ACTN|nr:hypothetical protein [Spongiactinospora gelatinilytica]PZG41734.1 hypothetical protein C1I98_20850 [Spongiactinospora gelatinilytica]